MLPKRILITPGEPAGIGPDVTLKALMQSWRNEIIVIADPILLLERAKKLNIPIEIAEWQADHKPTAHKPGLIKFFPIMLKEAVKAGELNQANALYVLQTLELATELCLNKTAQALVTGPVNKAVINLGGFSFSGHTEFLAKAATVSHTVMLFVFGHHKIALLTTHLPLKNVSQAITKDLLITTLEIIRHDLRKYFHIDYPRIHICGLNPHAGEGGYLGNEETEIITPVIEELNQKGFDLDGPFSADTIFTSGMLKTCDVILAMYHDQALPVIKHMAFGQAVNVSLGLPFIRTSVDHGTALTLAGSHEADASSMISAIELASEMLC